MEAIIADRIEGKVGHTTRRGGPRGPAPPRRHTGRHRIRFVTAMVNAKIAGADDSSEDSASDRTAVVIDAEAPR